MDEFIVVNGVYFSKINLIFYVIGMFVEPYYMQLFYGHFMEHRIANRKKSYLFLVIMYGMVNPLWNFLCSWSETRFPKDVAFLLGSLSYIMILLLAVCFFKASAKMTLFCIISYWAIGNLCSQFVSFLPVSMMYYVVLLVLTYVFVRYIVKNVSIKDAMIQKKDLFLLILPSLTCIFISELLTCMKYVLVENVSQVYEKAPFLYVVILAILLLSLFSIVHSLKEFQNMVVRNRDQSNQMVLEKQIDSMQEYIKELEQLWSGIRRLKHDMRNTLSVVTQLSNGNTEEQDELQSYLSGLRESMDQLEMRFQTGNVVADMLLNMKYREALQELPDLVLDADMLFFSEKLMIQNYDIGIILGNALDNAVEACKELKTKNPNAKVFIRLMSVQKRKMFLLEVENSFDGKLLLASQAEFPMTKKENGELHGIGLENIKSAAEKYQGAVEWNAEGQVFSLSVMLKNISVTEEA